MSIITKTPQTKSMTEAPNSQGQVGFERLSMLGAHGLVPESCWVLGGNKGYVIQGSYREYVGIIVPRSLLRTSKKRRQRVSMKGFRTLCGASKT